MQGERAIDQAFTEQFEHDNNRQLTHSSRQAIHDTPSEQDQQYWKIEQSAGRVHRRGQDTYHYDTLGRLSEKHCQRNGFRPQVWRYRWNEQDQLVGLHTP